MICKGNVEQCIVLCLLVRSFFSYEALLEGHKTGSQNRVGFVMGRSMNHSGPVKAPPVSK